MVPMGLRHLLLASCRPRQPLVLWVTRAIHSDSRDLPITHPAVCVWGANTCVGKTLISAGLVAAAVRNKVFVQYVKPVQTGYPQDSDSRLLAAAAKHTSGQAAMSNYLRESTTLFTYKDPVSPHLAAVAEQRVVHDDVIVSSVKQQLQRFTAELQRLGPSSKGLTLVETAGGVASPGPSGTLQADLLRPLSLPALLVGDPNLGGISTTLSAYESLLLRGHIPVAVVMMVDRRLKNVEAVAHHLQHAAAHRLGQELPVLAVPLCPPPSSKHTSSSSSSSSGNAIDSELAQWLDKSQPEFDQLLHLLQKQHTQHLAWLQGAAAEASSSVWWPFTQHAQLPNSNVTVVDGRVGEDWLVYKQQQHQHQPPPMQQPQRQHTTPGSSSSSGDSIQNAAALTPLYDAASSWWTQTAATPELQLEVCRAVAAAAGRYMHVMWPQVAHAPGLKLTETLLNSPLAGSWASRVFYSDDGSTAIEIALKMAFRKYMVDHGLLEEHGLHLRVCALQNSYHGDTLGAMDCAAASPYNGRLQTPWYTGRGLFLHPPYIQMQQGRWQLQQPGWLQQQQHAGSRECAGGNNGGWAWSSRQQVFDLDSRARSQLQHLYSQHINKAIDAYEAQPSSSSNDASSSRHLAALLIEPVVQAAGGMLLVDPLFQSILVQVAKQRRIPVVYDEVFTGCWRLGTPTAGQLLHQEPDIACYAKLLTGGVAPLAVTLATEAVFNAFKGPSKVEALLHGHSYTAYPLGCAAALASLVILQNPAMNPNICAPAIPGRCQKQGAAHSAGGGNNTAAQQQQCCQAACGDLVSLWDDTVPAKLSHHPHIKGVMVIGSVFAIELRQGAQQAAAAPAASTSKITSSSGAGSSDRAIAADGDCSKGAGAGSYGSSAALDIVCALRQRGVAARPVGHVVYMMVPPTTTRHKCDWLLQQLMEVLESDACWGSSGGDWVLI